MSDVHARPLPPWLARMSDCERNDPVAVVVAALEVEGTRHARVRGNRVVGALAAAGLLRDEARECAIDRTTVYRWSQAVLDPFWAKALSEEMAAIAMKGDLAPPPQWPPPGRDKPLESAREAQMRAALERIARGDAFVVPRYAEDSESDYFLRAQKNAAQLARAALEGGR